MSLGTITVLHEIDLPPGAGHIRLISVVGDGAYATPGSFGFADKFNAAVGGTEAIIASVSQPAGDVGTEYIPQGEPVEVTALSASTDLFTAASGVHGLVSTNPVEFQVDPGDANALPGGIVAGTAYFVIAGGLTTTSFKVSATSGGAAIDLTTPGKGRFRVVAADRLLTRTVSTGAEFTTADQSGSTYKMLVVSK